MSDNTQPSQTDQASQTGQASQSSQIAPAESSTPATRGRALDPFAVFSEMEDMMDRMFGRRWPFSRPLRRLTESGGGWSPHVDMYEEGDTIVVKAELPGISRDDVDLSVENGDLVIQGERTSRSEIREEQYYRMERSFGAFYRRLPLPEGIDPRHHLGQLPGRRAGRAHPQARLRWPRGEEDPGHLIGIPPPSWPTARAGRA